MLVIILIFISGCARWKQEKPIPKKVWLTITISFSENVNSEQSLYFIAFDNDNNPATGPYVTQDKDGSWVWNYITHRITLKNKSFYFATLSPTGETIVPFVTAVWSGKTITINIPVSDFGNPVYLQINVATYDKDGKIIDFLNKNKEPKDAYISLNLTSQFYYTEQDNAGDVDEINKHLDIVDVKITRVEI